MDVCDQAQEIEEAERTAALRRALRPSPFDGLRVRAVNGECLECGEPIPAARLAAQPDAVRCTACQGLREARAM